MRTATKNTNAIELAFDNDPMIVAFVKALDPRRKYSPATKCWYIPIAGGGPILERLEKNGFTVHPELWEAVRADADAVKEVEALAVMDDAEFESPLPLFPFQRVGATFLYNIGSGLLGDDVGCGKTIQSLAVCEKSSAQKVLIFCPSSVKWQWAGEIEKFLYPAGAPKDAIVVIEGKADERERIFLSDHRFYIANYELLLRDFKGMSCRKWDIIIADEATKISNAQAKTSKAIKKLKAHRRIAMTGTPISNRANEIWNLIDFCVPGAFGNYHAFLQRYCLKNHWGAITAYQNMDELSSILKRYMIRRMKVDVMTELPEKIVTDIPFDLTDEEKALYKRLKKEILFEIEKTDIDKIESPMSIQYTLVKMLRLRQLADSMELLGHNTKSSKLTILKELLESSLAGNTRKAIIFTQFAEMADILERELAEYKPLKISGKIKEQYRDVVAQFNGQDENRVLIMTSAGQFGLNIQRASVVFHYDQEWSLAKMVQRDGRAYRYGQKESVLVYNLLAKGTVDYYIKKILHGKAELAGQILGDTPITMSDIREILKYE